MARKKKHNYFDSFGSQVDIALREAELLEQVIDEYEGSESFMDILEKAHALENDGDTIKRKTFESIALDFFTPFDREDVIDIASSLDDIVDSLESVIRQLYILDVHVVHPSCKKLVESIIDSLKALRVAQKEFSDFKRSKKFRHAVERVNEYEEQADKIYLESVRNLFAEESDDPVHVIKWSRLFDKLEDCCDACEHVCDVMESVVLKNS